MESDYDYSSALHAADLETPEKIGRTAGERAVARLNPRKVSTRKVPVVLNPRVAGSLVSHLASAVNGGAIARKTSFLRDKMGAKQWLRGVLGEARAALSDEIMHRFTDLQYALTLALDEAIERRLQQLDAYIATIDKAMAEDKAERTKRKAALAQEREGLRARIKQLDEVLVRVRQLLPAAPADGQG